MLVLQQVDVLHKGANIAIYDGNKLEVAFEKSVVDGSLIFDSANDADRYNKVFSTYRVYEVKGVMLPLTFSDNPENFTVPGYKIQIREGYEDENQGAASGST